MSDTPRTDALLFTINEGRVHENDGPVARIARHFERELAAAQAENAKLREERDAYEHKMRAIASGYYGAQQAAELARSALSGGK